MCSSFHSANGDQTVQRRVKTPDGKWTEKTAISESKKEKSVIADSLEMQIKLFYVLIIVMLALLTGTWEELMYPMPSLGTIMSCTKPQNGTRLFFSFC